MADVDLWKELFEAVPGTSLRRMFGGIGVFRDGLMYALVTGEGIAYFKADETTSPRFEAEGFGQWVYPGRDRAVPMPYWQIPDRLFDEADEFAEWAEAAFAAAVRSKAAPKKKAGGAKKKATAKPASKASVGKAGRAGTRKRAVKKAGARKPGKARR